MSTLTLQVPDELLQHQNEIIGFIAAKLYESGKLSLGQAAEMTGLSKPAFAEIPGDYNLSLINYPVTEMLRDAARI